MSGEPIETDQAPGAEHPRRQFAFFGHEAAEAAMGAALRAQRRHHAWLITGPKGIGKASLAYRFARRLLGAPQAGPRPLDCDPDHGVCRRIAALSHPDLFVLRRGLNERGRPRQDISAAEARALAHFLNLTPAEGGFRVAIVDCVDDLNAFSANALLKPIEEPPPNAVLLLICHAPGAALATIRSRCRKLPLAAVSEADCAAALAAAFLDKPIQPAVIRFAAGRPGRAITLAANDIGGVHDRFVSAIARANHEKRSFPLAQLAFDAGPPEERLALFFELAQDWARRAARAAAGLTHPDGGAREQDVLAQAAHQAGGEAWAEIWRRLEEVRLEAAELSIDPRHAYTKAAMILAEPLVR